MIHIIRMAVAIILLSIASYQDIKTRHVSDKIWYIMVIIGGSLFVYDSILGNIGVIETFFTVMLITMAYVIFLTFNKWQQGSFGGADAKAFICIALLLPVPFVFGMFPFSYMIIVWGELMAFAWYFPRAMKVPKEKWKNITFPLIPFLLIGLIFTIVIDIVYQNMM